MKTTDKLFSGENIISEDKEIFVVILIATLIFCGIMIGTGSLWSGYHMIDDHHVITKTYLIEEEGFINATVQSVAGDLSLRFRPLYWTMHLVKCAVFGPNYFAWMLLSMIEGIVSFVAIYAFARNTGSTQVEAFFFASIVIFGSQFQPWYRSSNQENAGFMFCALGLFFMSRTYTGKNIADTAGQGRSKRILDLILFLFFITLATLEKEAFIVFLPAYLLMIMMMIRDRDVNTSFGTLFKRELPVIIYIILLMIAELYIIVRFVGTNKIGYAGFGDDVGIMTYIKGIAKTVVYPNGIRWYVLAILVSVIIVIIRKPKLSSVNIWLVFSFGYIIMTQILLHARSTMVERYILPCSVGFALFLATYCFRLFREDRTAYLCQTGVVTLLVVIGLIQSISMTYDWACSGKEFNRMLEGVRDVIREDEGSDILVNYGADEVEGSVADFENQFGTWNWYHAHDEFFEYRRFDRTFDYIVSYYEGWYDSGNEFCEAVGIDASEYTVIYTDPDKEYVVLKQIG